MRCAAVLALAVAACGAPERPAPRPVVAPPIAAPAPAPTPPPPVAPAQVFAAHDPQYGFADPQRRKKLEAAFPAIDKALAEAMKRQQLPGFAIGIVIDGELAYAKGFGVTEKDGKTAPDADTVYRIGSITKSFTGLATIALRDDGALGIDDPLVKWMPEAAGLVYPTRDAAPITLRQLLTHTSGLPRMGTFDFEADPTEAIVGASLAKLALDNAPGMAHVYSNLGFGLLGIVVGRASHSSLHDVVKKRIFDPLGMTSTYWRAEDVPAGKLAATYDLPGNAPKQPARLGSVDGAGGIYSSVRDMARYAAFQLAAYPPRNTPEQPGAIRRASVREVHSTGVAAGTNVMLAPDAKPGEPAINLRVSNYGFGWVHIHSCRGDVVWHNGAIDSYRAELAVYPTRGVAVVALTNFAHGTDPMPDIVADELRKTGAFEERAAEPDPAMAPALAKLLDVMNSWDEAKYKAMLDPNRPPLLEIEKVELAGYKALHGTCKPGPVTEVEAANVATFALVCERGKLEMQLQLAPGGGIGGFNGTTRGLTAPPQQVGNANAVMSLMVKWDDAIYKKHLAKILPAADIKAVSEQLRRQHGSCKVRAAVHVATDWHYELDCARGGPLVLETAVDPANPDVYTRLLVHPPLQRGGPGCPVR